jgi:hypothetical protein
MTDPRQPGSLAPSSPSSLPPVHRAPVNPGGGAGAVSPGGMHRIVPGPSHGVGVGHAGHGHSPGGDETIALVDGAAQQTTSKIKAFGVDAERRRDDWKRKAHVGGTGVCRVRSFHGKYSDSGLAHMDDMINEWLDSHPDVEVKFITSTVGVFEGKIREPALVLNVWY